MHELANKAEELMQVSNKIGFEESIETKIERKKKNIKGRKTTSTRDGWIS